MCPGCGNAFANRNNWHSCISIPLEDHFNGRPQARALFEAFRAAVEATGPVTLVSGKTRIAFMTRARFAGIMVRKDYLRVSIWLKRRIDSSRFRVEAVTATDFMMTFDVRVAADIDDEIRALLLEAREGGDQRTPAQARRYAQ